MKSPSVAEHVEATRQRPQPEHLNNPLFYNGCTLGVALFVFMLLFNSFDGPVVILAFPACSFLVGFVCGVGKAKGLEVSFWVGYGVIIVTAPLLLFSVPPVFSDIFACAAWKTALIFFSIVNTIFLTSYFMGLKWESHSIKLRNRRFLQ